MVGINDCQTKDHSLIYLVTNILGYTPKDCYEYNRYGLFFSWFKIVQISSVSYDGMDPETVRNCS
jgi:hypothetical protein